MNKVFAVVEQSFFISNGIDYAMPMDEDDVDLFSSYDNAIYYFEDRTEEISKFCGVKPEECTDHLGRKMMRWTKSNGSRVFLKIIQKEVQ